MLTIADLQRELFQDARHQESLAFKAIIARYRRSHEYAIARYDKIAEAIEQQIAKGTAPIRAMLLESDRLANFIAEISDDLIKAGVFTAEETRSLQSKLLDLGNRDGHLLLANGTAAAGIAVQLNRVSTPALKALVAGFDVRSPLSQLANGLAKRGSERLHDILDQGTIRGLSPRALVPSIARSLEIDKTQALTIARTEGIRPYRSANLANFEANAEYLSGWRWLATLDLTCCPACIALHGTIHPLSEPFGGHPNCRCSPAPKVIGDDRVFRQGEEWFAGLDHDGQRAILGQKGFATYEDGSPLSSWVHTTNDGQWGLTRRSKSP